MEGYINIGAHDIYSIAPALHTYLLPPDSFRGAYPKMATVRPMSSPHGVSPLTARTHPQNITCLRSAQISAAPVDEGDEAARRKRIAERLRQQGGFNPFGAPPALPVRRPVPVSPSEQEATLSRRANEDAPPAIHAPTLVSPQPPPAQRRPTVDSVHVSEPVHEEPVHEEPAAHEERLRGEPEEAESSDYYDQGEVEEVPPPQPVHAGVPAPQSAAIADKKRATIPR